MPFHFKSRDLLFVKTNLSCVTRGHLWSLCSKLFCSLACVFWGSCFFYRPHITLVLLCLEAWLWLLGLLQRSTLRPSGALQGAASIAKRRNGSCVSCWWCRSMAALLRGQVSPIAWSVRMNMTILSGQVSTDHHQKRNVIQAMAPPPKDDDDGVCSFNKDYHNKDEPKICKKQICNFLFELFAGQNTHTLFFEVGVTESCNTARSI